LHAFKINSGDWITFEAYGKASDTNTETRRITLKNSDLEIGLVLFKGKDIDATLKT